MNNLQIFEKLEFGQIRMAEIDNKPYFVGKDIAKSLGYKNTNDAILRHCKGVVKHEGFKINGIKVALITEGDVYRLIVGSNLPNAEKFESWVFDEVLPTIRQTGQYQLQQDVITELTGTIGDLKGTIKEYKKLCKITCSKKQQYSRYIKNRLDIDKANKEYNQVKARLFLILGVEKWEDIDFDTSNNLIQIIDDCIRVIKSERPYKQLSYFEL
ncbi:BRO family protein [Clostridioides difficile]|uniref:BRO-N domain-containing protein n=1 Tax=Clostridioides difficile TaxID=1496 RepID=UPI0020C352A1|nr:BRO family protein [Clostridioides difficile]MCP8367001.1 BRO family protein [Clostridioides difficile]